MALVAPFFRSDSTARPGEMKWIKVGEDRRGDNGNWPSPRSACALGEFEDTVALKPSLACISHASSETLAWSAIKDRNTTYCVAHIAVSCEQVFLFGGYTKLGKALGGTDESRGIVHTDTWCFDLKTISWSKVRKAGIPPTPRCGFSSSVHKKRNLVVFGGVISSPRHHRKPSKLRHVNVRRASRYHKRPKNPRLLFGPQVFWTSTKNTT